VLGAVEYDTSTGIAPPCGLQLPTYPHTARPCIDLDQNERMILDPADPILTCRDMRNHRWPGSDELAPPLI
jgi:hypothetical protein